MQCGTESPDFLARFALKPGQRVAPKPGQRVALWSLKPGQRVAQDIPTTKVLDIRACGRARSADDRGPLLAPLAYGSETIASRPHRNPLDQPKRPHDDDQKPKGSPEHERSRASSVSKFSGAKSKLYGRYYLHEGPIRMDRIAGARQCLRDTECVAIDRTHDDRQVAPRSVNELIVVPATADLLTVAAIELGPGGPGTAALAAERGPEPAADRHNA